ADPARRAPAAPRWSPAVGARKSTPPEPLPGWGETRSAPTPRRAANPPGLLSKEEPAPCAWPQPPRFPRIHSALWGPADRLASRIGWKTRPSPDWSGTLRPLLP